MQSPPATSSLPLLDRVLARLEHVLGRKGTGLIVTTEGLAIVHSFNESGIRYRRHNLDTQFTTHSWSDLSKEDMEAMLKLTDEEQRLANKRAITNAAAAKEKEEVVLYVVHRSKEGKFKLCAGRVEVTAKYYKLKDRGGYTDEFVQAFSMHNVFIEHKYGFLSPGEAVQNLLDSARIALERHKAIVETYEDEVASLLELGGGSVC